MRQTTIYAAILAEHGNSDTPYPRPLTCYVCGDRPGSAAYTGGIHPTLVREIIASTWYVTESDPLPAGWQCIEQPHGPARFIMCPSCYEDRAEGRELGYSY